MRYLAGLVILVVLAAATILAASELGGEVVVLRTFEGDRAHETSLWVVDAYDAQWLRGGNPSSGWVARLQQNPRVEMIRGGETSRYLAEIVPEKRRDIDPLIRERYGIADRIISLIHDKSELVIVRLDPR